MSDLDREAMEVDVVIVGAGPAGLSAAIRLKQLDPDLSVVLTGNRSPFGTMAFSAPSAPRAARSARPACGSRPSPLGAAAP